MEKRFVVFNEVIDNYTDPIRICRRAVDLNRIVGFYESEHHDGKKVHVEIDGFDEGELVHENSIRSIEVQESFDEVAKLTML